MRQTLTKRQAAFRENLHIIMVSAASVRPYRGGGARPAQKTTVTGAVASTT